ncbi:MAG: PfkB family carbohydrate kinase [Christensenellales bacterium]|nr:PfkB family carbohydrate kinase [Christensenellales bacterium]
MKTVLLLGDLTGRSRVALRMLCSVLEAHGHEVLMLPTALISNTLNLGRYAALDTTDYLLSSLCVWEELGLHMDLAYIGYITGMEQAERLAEAADKLRKKGVPVVLDPILGDGGRKYNAVTEEQVEGMRLLMRHADLMTPNWTEARLLLDEEETNGTALAARLAQNGCGVLVTSAQTQAGQDAVLGCTPEGAFALPFERVPGHHWGTGDLFTGLLIDGLLAGQSVEAAAREAVEGVGKQLRGKEKSLLPQQNP